MLQRHLSPFHPPAAAAHAPPPLLQDYSPDYCLALLGLPLSDPARPRGSLLLRKLLWELPEEVCPLGPADRDDFLAAARPLLTAQEHVSTQGQG